MSDGLGSTNWFLDGIKFGFGFSIPFVLLFALAGVLTLVGMLELTKRILYEEILPEAFGPEVGLRILHHESDQLPGNLIVRGQIRNDGKNTWDHLRLQVDLLDGSGQFVGLCDGRVIGPLHPNQERNFSVDCNGSDSSPLPAFKRYTIQVVDAFYRTLPEERHGGA